MENFKTNKAVILAAGWGSRIQAIDQGNDPVSKPLVELGNIALIERVIRTLAKAGVTEFVIVTGYMEEEVKGVVTELGVREGLTINTVFNDKWNTLANGVSLLAASEMLDGSFILSMSDHAFDVDIPTKLNLEGDRGMGVRLCIDKKLETIFDMDDATKVQLEGDKIIEIDKSLREYNAVDIGLFFCNMEILEELQVVYKEQGDCSLSDGMRRLGAKGKFGFMDIADKLWQDVDTPETHVYAEKLLAEKGLKFPD